MKYFILLLSVLAYSQFSLAQLTRCSTKLTSARAMDLEKFVKKSARPKEGKAYIDKVLKKLYPALEPLSAECAKANKKEKFPVRMDVYLEINAAGEQRIEFDAANVILCECIVKSFPTVKDLGAPPTAPFFVQLGVTFEAPNRRGR